jgi:sugar lactone lactonase YvrE
MYPTTQPVRSLVTATAFTLTAILGVTATSAGQATLTPARPEARVYVLDPSTHGNPEGVAYDPRTATFFVGTIGDGTIYRASLTDAQAHVFIPGTEGGQATGLKVWGDRLYVAGGATGQLRVYEIATGALVATFDTGEGGLLNDLAITNDGDVYVTDSFRPYLWHITPEQLEAGTGVAVGIPVDPEITYDPFAFNLNGIVALKGGKRLIVGHSATGELFRIDLDETSPLGRTITRIDAEPLFSDGLLLDRGHLVAVTFYPAPTLTFVRLDAKDATAVVVASLPHPSFTDPSTVARARNSYLVVNADFLTSTPPFTVTALPRNANLGKSEP